MRRLNEQGFRATPAQKLYAAVRAVAGDDETQRALAARAGVSEETVSRWKQERGFAEWLMSSVARHRAPILELLRQVAIDNVDDYRFWEALAYKYGFLNRDDKPAAVQQFVKPMDTAALLEVVRTIRGGK